MAMVSDILATRLADNMKARGLFDIPTPNGKVFSQDSYNTTLDNLKADQKIIIDYLKESMQVVGVTTSVTTVVSTPQGPGTGTGTGTQTSTGSVI